jgi:hypothetical protein
MMFAALAGHPALAADPSPAPLGPPVVLFSHEPPIVVPPRPAEPMKRAARTVPVQAKPLIPPAPAPLGPPPAPRPALPLETGLQPVAKPAASPDSTAPPTADKPTSG